MTVASKQRLDGSLPYRRRVAWLQSSSKGGQYIDTGLEGDIKGGMKYFTRAVQLQRNGYHGSNGSGFWRDGYHSSIVGTEDDLNIVETEENFGCDWGYYVWALKNKDGTPEYFCTNCKIRRFTIYDKTRNGQILRDLIAVLDLYGEPCMYDEVSGELFYNLGTGEFTYGELS